MVYRPKTGEEALEEPPLSLEVSYYIQQQLDARSGGYSNEEQRILRKLKKKRCFKSFKAYHDTKMDLFMPC